MKMNVVLPGCLAGLAAVVFAGCTTPTDPAKSSTRAAPLKAKNGTWPGLRYFAVATVRPFETTKAKQTDPSVGVKFAEEIARRLKHDFDQVFDQVQVGDPNGATNELTITGEITKYSPGDRALRGILIGLAERLVEIMESKQLGVRRREIFDVDHSFFEQFRS